MNTTATLSSAQAGYLGESPWSGVGGIDPRPYRGNRAHAHRRRCVIDGAAAVLAGSIVAVGWAAFGAADDRANGRRAQLEREMTQMASPLAELARIERTLDGAKTNAARRLARERPIVEMRALLDALSREANEGVIVSRLQRSDEGIELRIRAADSAACAAWVERLARMPEWASAETIELKSIAAPAGRRGEHMVEAAVRLRWRDMSPPSHSAAPLRRPALADRARGARNEP